MSKVIHTMRIEDVNNIMSLDLVEVGEGSPENVYTDIVLNRYNQIVELDKTKVDIDQHIEGNLVVGTIISFAYHDSRADQRFYKVTGIEENSNESF